MPFGKTVDCPFNLVLILSRTRSGRSTPCLSPWKFAANSRRSCARDLLPAEVRSEDGRLSLQSRPYPVEDTIRKVYSLPVPMEIRSQLAAVLRSGSPPG